MRQPLARGETGALHETDPSYHPGRIGRRPRLVARRARRQGEPRLAHQAADQADRHLPARRHRRHDFAYPGAQALGRARNPGGGREPARRRWHDRLGSRGQGRPGRLHAGHFPCLAAGHCARHLSQAAVQRDYRFHPCDADRSHTQRPDRAGRFALQDAGRLHRRRQGQARRDRLRQLRHRFQYPPDGRTAGQPGRNQAEACALSRLRALAAGHAGRRHPVDVRPDHDQRAAHQFGQGPPAGGQLGQAPRHVPERADFRRAGLPQAHHLDLGRRLGTQGHVAGRRGAAL